MDCPKKTEGFDDCEMRFDNLDELSAFLYEELGVETAVYDYYIETTAMLMTARQAKALKREIMELLPDVYSYIVETYDEYAVRIELED